MKLTNELKTKIKEFNANLIVEDFDDRHEQVMDYILDNDLFDLSDDKDGDMYEELSNLVYEFLEEL